QTESAIIGSRKHSGRQEIYIACAWQVDAAREDIVGAHRNVFVQQTLDTDVGLHAVRRDKARVGAKDRWRDARNRSENAPATCRREDLRSISIGCDLLKTLCSILLDRAVQKSER